MVDLDQALLSDSVSSVNHRIVVMPEKIVCGVSDV